MPNSQNSKDLQSYFAMSTEELQKILRDDASNDEGNEEIADLLCIMEVLAQRRQTQNEGRNPEEALEVFRKYYREDVESSETEREKPEKWHTFYAWVKRLAAVAAIVFLLFTGILTAKAMGFDLWAVITKWTQEAVSLHYETPPTVASIPLESLPDPTEVFESLQEALDAYGMDSSIVPTWVPEGYDRLVIDIYADEAGRNITASYISGREAIMITVSDYQPDSPWQHQQSGGTCEIYERNGVQYILYKNYERNNAAWLVDGYECFIGGAHSEEELKKMIDSIEKG